MQCSSEGHDMWGMVMITSFIFIKTEKKHFHENPNLRFQFNRNKPAI